MHNLFLVLVEVQAVELAVRHLVVVVHREHQVHHSLVAAEVPDLRDLVVAVVADILVVAVLVAIMMVTARMAQAVVVDLTTLTRPVFRLSRVLQHHRAVTEA
jgi:hypothetical protein